MLSCCICCCVHRLQVFVNKMLTYFYLIAELRLCKLYGFQSASNTSATTAATNTQPEVMECLNGHDAIKVFRLWSVTVKLVAVLCSWPISDNDAVLRTSEDFSFFPSILYLAWCLRDSLGSERLRLKPGSRTVWSEIRHLLARDVECQASLHLDAASTGVHKCSGEDVLLTMIVMRSQLLSVCYVSLTVSV